jgi:pimeloyl-ACP methyl ester carboxylesterase
MEGGSSVATNFSVVDPGGDEPCDATADGYNIAPPDLLDWTPTDAPKFKTVLTNYAPPAAGFDVGAALQGHQPKREEYNVSALQNINSSTPMALNIGANEGRLRGDLRLVAANANPSQSLCKAAVAFALGNPSDGKAFADLSVTGRRTFAAFKAQPPQEAEILRCLGANTSTAGLPDATKQHAAALALDRAYGVLNIIRAGRWPKDSTCRATRDSFGYIAVSGEDDQPHRPVNVPSAEFPQYDLAVMVRRPYRQSDLAVNTRYMIAHTVEPPNAERATCAKTGRTIPANRTPVLASDAEVILYVHGHDSNLEEALDLTRQIRELGIAQKKNYTVISMDLPTSGYSDQIDPSAIAPLDSTGHAPGHLGPEDLAVLATAWAGVPAAMLHEVSYAPNGYTAPLVDFDEEFIVSFVNTLDRSLHGALSQRLRAIVGGSLGGNMAMRLGRPRADAPWVRNVVPWSPAGIWESLADDPTKHPGLAIPWYLAGGDATYAREDSGSRRSFFYGGFDWRSRILFGIPVGGARPQSEFWTDATWHCHQASMRLARIARFEVYNQNFRRWHWRLAMEQLQNSHWSRKAGTSVPLYLFNTRRTLLMCGIDDTGGDLCKFAQFMAPKMDDTPGRALFLTNTGHSIHDERPKFLARQIIDFIERP